MSPKLTPTQAREAAFITDLSATLAVWAADKIEAAGLEKPTETTFLVLIQAAARVMVLGPAEYDETAAQEAADLLKTSAAILRRNIR